MKDAQFKGYTILEVMIVITVSAFMFIVVAIAFGGQQQQVQFTQAVRDFDSKLIDIMNDVSTGYYNKSNNIGCSILSPADPNERPSLDGNSVTPDTQGSSDECVFIGKAIQFVPDSESTSTIYVYNIIGRRNNSFGIVSSLEEARPVAVAPEDDFTVDSLGLLDQVAIINLDWGLQVTDIQDSTPTDFGVIGFFTTFSKSLGVGANQINVSNNQSVRFGGIPGTTLGQVTDEAVRIINSITDNSADSAPATTFVTLSDLSTSSPITICLKSADGNKRAALALGL